MPTFDLELRVRTFGSIITWKIFLEDSTNEAYRVRDWVQHPDGYRIKKLPNYKIKDNYLDVFAGCQGIEGGKVSCEVLVNNVAKTEQVIARPTDRSYATESYPITNQGNV